MNDTNLGFQDMLCQVVPVVDGNVIRVLARLKAISANPRQGDGQEILVSFNAFYSLLLQFRDLAHSSLMTGNFIARQIIFSNAT